MIIKDRNILKLKLNFAQKRLIDGSFILKLFSVTTKTTTNKTHLSLFFECDNNVECDNIKDDNNDVEDDNNKPVHSWLGVMKLRWVFTSNDISWLDFCDNSVESEDVVEGENNVDDVVKGYKYVDKDTEYKNNELVHVTVWCDEIVKGAKKLAQCFLYF